MNPNNRKRLIIFLILTYSISWAIWLISGVLFREGNFVYDSKWLFSQTGVFVPTITGIILISLKSKRNIIKNISIIFLSFLIFIIGFIIINHKPVSIKEFDSTASISVFLLAVFIIVIIYRFKYFFFSTEENKSNIKLEFKWVLLSIIIFPVLFLLSWLIVSSQGQGLNISTLKNGLDEFIQILFVAFSMNLILGGSMGEEFGWRGFVLPLLLKKYNPTAAGIVLGIIWAFWHLPIDLTSTIIPGPFAFIFRIIWVIPLSIIITWFFIKTNGSILIALLLHTSLNFLPDIGFANYQASILLMTFLLIIVASIIAFKPEMRTEIK
ncbi:MAG: CPBP family intramembrane glutamic endopeptidase [bacterium]